MMSRPSWWPILMIIGMALAAELAIILPAPLPIRAPVVLGFLLLGPGLVFVRLLRIPSLSMELTLSVALSVTLDLLLSEVAVLVGAFSASTVMTVLVFVTVVVAVLQAVTSGIGEWRAAGE